MDTQFFETEYLRYQIKPPNHDNDQNHIRCHGKTTLLKSRE
jgi:hypothetical protein